MRLPADTSTAIPRVRESQDNLAFSSPPPAEIQPLTASPNIFRAKCCTFFQCGVQGRSSSSTDNLRSRPVFRALLYRPPILKLMTFRPKVRVVASDSERILFFAHAAEIESLFARRACKVELKDKRGLVVSVKLLATALALPVRPGSFNVTKRQVPVNNQYGLSGGVIYEHQRNLHDGHRQSKRLYREAEQNATYLREQVAA
jgi:hypothetical protein